MDKTPWRYTIKDLDKSIQLQTGKNIQDPFHKHGLNWILVWISNRMPSIMWDGTTYPFPNFNGWTMEFGKA